MMEANKLTSLKKNEISNHESCTCPNDECGKNFDHPIQLTVLSSDPVETYPACPYCMSRIEMEKEEREPQKQPRDILSSMKIKAALEKEQEKAEKKETVTEAICSHGFGYLKKRPKGTQIPDECLVCQKMIQCLS
jgi:DNA-directed RNA polymerase subunit RPC12/RpoP